MKSKDYEELEKDNKQYFKSLRFLTKEFNDATQEQLKLGTSLDSNKIVGKLNPKKHLVDTVEDIQILNLNQKLVGLVHKTIF